MTHEAAPQTEVPLRLAAVAQVSEDYHRAADHVP